MAALAYASYQATRHAWEGFMAVHGCYVGLSTGAYTHAHAQILVPLRGRLHVTADGTSHVLGPERAVLIPAATPHAATTLGGELEFVALNAPAAWLAELGAPPSAGLTLLADAGLWLAGRQLASAVSARGWGFERVAVAAAELLGLHAARAIAEPALALAPDPIVAAIDRMLRDHAEPLTVSALADAARLSPRQFERRFKAAVGLAPKAFLIAVRLAAARDRLATTTDSVEAVAVAVGFGHVSHFTRTFSDAMGMSPGAYRRAQPAR